jgi:hypothetical protein
MDIAFDFIRHVKGCLSRRQDEVSWHSVRGRLNVEIEEISSRDAPVALVVHPETQHDTAGTRTVWHDGAHWVPLTGYDPGNIHGDLGPADLSATYLTHSGVYTPIYRKRESVSADAAHRLLPPSKTFHHVEEDRSDADEAAFRSHITRQLVLVDGVAHSRIVEPHYGFFGLSPSHPRAFVERSPRTATSLDFCAPIRFSLLEYETMMATVSAARQGVRIDCPRAAYEIVIPESVSPSMAASSAPGIGDEIIWRAAFHERFFDDVMAERLRQLRDRREALTDTGMDDFHDACEGFLGDIETRRDFAERIIFDGGKLSPPVTRQSGDAPDIRKTLDVARRRWRAWRDAFDDGPISLRFQP